MSSFTNIYGIDISKDTLDLNAITFLKEKRQIRNRSKSIESWIKTLDANTSFCVVETTGTYSATLVYLLNQDRIPVALVSPFESKSFVEVVGVSNKTDDQAANCLAMLGLHLDLKPYHRPSENRQKRRPLQTVHNAMMKQRQMLVNQMHAIDQLPIIEQVARQAYGQTMKMVDIQIQKLEQQLEELEDDDDYREVKELACSVVGISPTTAHAMLLAANSFEHFDTADQLSKFFGLTSNAHYSGSSVRRKGKISKMLVG